MSIRRPASWSFPETAPSPPALSARTASVEDSTVANMMDSESLSLALDSPGLQRYLKEKPLSVELLASRLIWRVRGPICACLVIRHTRQHRSEERTTTPQAPHLMPPRLELRAEPHRSPNRSSEQRCSPVIPWCSQRLEKHGICRASMNCEKRSLRKLVMLVKRLRTWWCRWTSVTCNWEPATPPLSAV